MPIVFDFNKFKIYIYFKEHGVPHCHVRSKDGTCEASIRIDSVEVLASSGWSKKDLNFILKFVEVKQGDLMEAWHEYQEK
jgi:hypothetical protein